MCIYLIFWINYYVESIKEVFKKIDISGFSNIFIMGVLNLNVIEVLD